MADTTQFSEEMSREEVASALHEIAEEFAKGSGESVTLRLGNKRVTVQPGDSINYDISVTERSSMLRKDRQTLDLNLRWNPNKGGGD
ncbi:amphi-Trp domain-containing protein [Halobacteriales archaeon QS_5_70_17]|jgi:amphi-Trp domain-containing protein|nr:MAG: amphi-Trp domain-containing protein [Halobacteriales archaeon QS_5_70_17]